MSRKGHPPPKPHWTTIAWAVLAFVPALWGQLWYMRFGVVGALVGYFGLFALLGPMLISRAFRRRAGETLHCANCDYEFVYASDPSVTHPDLCPECGHGWADRLVKGRTTVSPVLVALWIFVTFVGLMIVVYGLSNQSDRLITVVPTSMLVNTVVGAGVIDDIQFARQWRELSSRTLTPAENERVGRMLVDSVGKARLGLIQSQWLKQAFGSSALPQAMLDEYLARRIVTGGRLTPPEVDGSRVFEIRVIDQNNFGYGEYFTVLSHCWIEPSGVELATNKGWYQPAIVFPLTKDDEKQSFIPTLPGIEESRPSLRVPIPRSVLTAKAENGKAPVKVRATVWVFYSPGVFVGSRVQPRDVVENPAMEPRTRLFQTLELEAIVDTDADARGGTH